MENISPTPIFETKGTGKRYERIIALSVIGLLFNIIIFFVSLGAPKIIGPWPLWAGLIVLLFLIMKYFSNRSKISVSLFSKNSNEMILKINKPGNNTELTFYRDDISYWYFHKQVATRNANWGNIVYYCTVTGIDYRKISFEQVFIDKGVIKQDWSFRDELIPDHQEIYSIIKLSRLVETINGNDQQN